MAARQAELHTLGRQGEDIVSRLYDGQKTSHKAPFDIVDLASGIAYEVKTMSALSKDLKIHIADSSISRKLGFAQEYGLRMVLIAVVIHSETKVEVYSGPLRQSMRLNQMNKISG